MDYLLTRDVQSEKANNEPRKIVLIDENKSDYSFFIYKSEVYFSAVHQGLFNIDQTNTVPKIRPILLHAKNYSLGLFNDTLYSANEGFINKYNIDLLTKKDPSSVRFGQSMV